ncbi:MAG: tryptophan synthase subunit alpha [Fidelibacterota bacterium]
MNRIQTLFHQSNEKVIPFFTAGYPRLDSTIDLVLAAERGGAAMVEIGIPFSDPIADGPVIQQSSHIALQNGITLAMILQQVRQIRKTSSIPIALMGYLNPILHFGRQTFLAEARDAGIDGLIIPDLPATEAEEFVSLTRVHEISLILLIAPNTPGKDITHISRLTQDLIYCVAVQGITGARLNGVEGLTAYLKRVKKYSRSPFVVGFGIKTREDVQKINRIAHGAVVGTNLLKKIKNADNPIEVAETYIRELGRKF